VIGPRLRVVVCALVGAALTAPASAQASAPASLRAIASSLPLTEVAADSGSTLALFLSGDGGWAGGDKAVAQALARSGVAVVGLDMRKYLRAAHRTPDGTARDAAEILEQYATAWHRDRLVLVGYSRGADLAPFVVSRLPATTRRRLALVALIGFADRASFEFHWEDLLHDVPRKTDLPTRPELERIRGTRILCVYGQGEKGSLCPSLDPSLARVAQHAGGHVLDASSGAAAAALVVNALR
jgi:type IV secretory pathway VirJ component